MSNVNPKERRLAFILRLQVLGAALLVGGLGCGDTRIPAHGIPQTRATSSPPTADSPAGPRTLVKNPALAGCDLGDLASEKFVPVRIEPADSALDHLGDYKLDEIFVDLLMVHFSDGSVGLSKPAAYSREALIQQAKRYHAAARRVEPSAVGDPTSYPYVDLWATPAVAHALAQTSGAHCEVRLNESTLVSPLWAKLLEKAR